MLLSFFTDSDCGCHCLLILAMLKMHKNFPVWTPHVTVAAIVERQFGDETRFLMVREDTRRGIKINQPAGHWEAEESLIQAVQREVRAALDFLAAHPQPLQALAEQRAQALLADHERVRAAARDVGHHSVSPCLPVDVMGVYVLLPDAL